MKKRHLSDPLELYSDEFVSRANPIEDFGHCYEAAKVVRMSIDCNKEGERNQKSVTKDTSSTVNQLTLLLAVVVEYLCTPEKMSVKRFKLNCSV
jgi:hypothetical protein